MLGKLAVRNTKRNLKDYLIYLITITISFSLILAFNLIASSDEVVKLSSGMDSFKNVLTFVNIIIVFVVCFLINYTTRFMFEKRSKEFGTYMLLGIKKKEVARLLVMENILLGFLALILAIPLGFLFSQFVSLVIVKLLGIPEVIFISLNLISVGLLVIYFLAIYVLVLLNLLRRIRKMTVHDFLYFDKQNEKKMFRNNKKRNIIFMVSAVLGVSSLLLWNSRCSFENFSDESTMTYLMICVIMLIISIYGISATCADMLLSILLKSKKMKYQNDNLFVTRTFASKARTMSFTFGTLSMLILLSLLCLNFSSIYKGLYQTSIELTSPYDVEVFDWTQPFDDYKEYLDVIDEDYTIKETIEYNVYKEPKSMNDEIGKITEEKQDYQEYVESFVHEIKIPIGALSLTFDNTKNYTLKKETDKIFQLVEQMLYYARSENTEKDYFVKQLQLDEVIHNVILKFRHSLMERKAIINIHDIENVIYTDEKWLTFILSQIVQNAIKYFDKQENKLTIYSQDNGTNILLVIEDNGCGIKASDLSRVFEKGFTGSNRNKANATGMGLYLSKKLCDRLGLKLDIASTEKEYTRLTITFPKGTVHNFSE